MIRRLQSKLKTVLKFEAKPTFLVLMFLVSLVGINLRYTRSNTNLNGLANQVYKQCQDVTAVSVQRCYDEKIPQLMNSISMEDAFQVIKNLQQIDNSYWFCHPVAHKLSALEYQKDPSKWKEVMTRCPVGMCSNGCLHGAIQAHFSSDTLDKSQTSQIIPDLTGICEKRANWNPTEQEISSCYHEVGHLSMYLTNASVPDSAKICDVVAVKADERNYTQTCHEGIFMQVFEPREPDDFSLVYSLIPIKDAIKPCEAYTLGIQKGDCWKYGWQNGEYAKFCDQFDGDVRYACFREAWVVQGSAIESAPGIINYCSYTTDRSENRKCYNKLIYGLMAKYEFDEGKVEKICADLPGSLKNYCYADIATRLIETDHNLISRSLAVCDLARQNGVAIECYQQLIHYAHFLFYPKSKEQTDLCLGLPDPWNKVCFSEGATKKN